VLVWGVVAVVLAAALRVFCAVCRQIWALLTCANKSKWEAVANLCCCSYQLDAQVNSTLVASPYLGCVIKRPHRPSGEDVKCRRRPSCSRCSCSRSSSRKGCKKIS
jgi:hypothetical protein